MRLGFAGTPRFAVPALDALHAAGHELAVVYTQPDRPAGRGRRLQPSAVAVRACVLHLPVHKTERFDAQTLESMRGLALDALIVVAYGLILPAPALAIPRYGCLNIHASLLPRWRGAAPLQRAILAGDRETGVSIMRMDAGLDTGPVLLTERVPIDDRATAGELEAELADLGARLTLTALDGLAAGLLPEQAQPDVGVTYARKISKEEARIDWTQTAQQIDRQIRAFHPAPVAWTELQGERVRIHAAHCRPAAADAPPGTVVAADPQGLQVTTGDGLLSITALQWPGGRPLTAAQATAGRALEGCRFA